MRYEIRKACRGQISQTYDHTEIVEFARTEDQARKKLYELVPQRIPAKEAGIFDAGRGRWLPGFIPHLLVRNK